MTDAEIDALVKKAIESIRASLETEAAAVDRAKASEKEGHGPKPAPLPIVTPRTGGRVEPPSAHWLTAGFCHALG